MAVIEAIATTYLEADAASVTFSSIPQTYEHLQLRMTTRCTTASELQYFNMQLGGVSDSPVDTGTNYSLHFMGGIGAATTAGSSTGQTNMWLWRLAGASLVATEYDLAIIDFLDYRNTNKNTTVLGMTGYGFDYGGGTMYLKMSSGLWDDTEAVTTIKVFPQADSWTRGSEFTLYGLNSS